MAVPVEEQPHTAVRVRHPIGVGASPFEEQITEANREALSQCLRLFYQGKLDPRCIQVYGEQGTGRTSRHSATGLELAARFTSKLEIGHALRRLMVSRRDLWQVIVRYYHYDQPKQYIERDLHLRHGEASKRIDAGLNEMIPWVFFDDSEITYTHRGG